MGFSGSASMSLALASSQAATSANSKKSKKVTIAYKVSTKISPHISDSTDRPKFPRITVFLDSRSLELTPECMEALHNIKTTDDFYGFQKIYGML